MSSSCSNDFKKTMEKVSKNGYESCSKYSGFEKTICEEMQKIRLESSRNAGTNNINATLSTLVGKIGCDSECQRRKKIDELKKKWHNAEKIQQEAPENTEDAERNYYVYEKGESGWKEVLIKRYTNIANENKHTSLKEHKLLIDELDTLIKDYQGETVALNKLKVLLKIRLEEQKNLVDAVDSEQSSAQTNDRRVVYGEWAQEWLGTIKSLLIAMYIIIAVAYIFLGPLIKESEYKTLNGWIKPIIIVIIPFIIRYIVDLIYVIKSKLAWWFDNLAPKDVYR